MQHSEDARYSPIIATYGDLAITHYLYVKWRGRPKKCKLDYMSRRQRHVAELIFRRPLYPITQQLYKKCYLHKREKKTIFCWRTHII